MGLEIFFGSKKFVEKFFWLKKIWVGNFFGSKKIGLDIFFWPEFLLSQTRFWSKKLWVKKIWVDIFFLHESSCWVKIGLHAENQLPGWSGSGLKVFRGAGGWVRIPII